MLYLNDEHTCDGSDSQKGEGGRDAFSGSTSPAGGAAAPDSVLVAQREDRSPGASKKLAAGNGSCPGASKGRVVQATPDMMRNMDELVQSSMTSEGRDPVVSPSHGSLLSETSAPLDIQLSANTAKELLRGTNLSAILSVLWSKMASTHADQSFSVGEAAKLWRQSRPVQELGTFVSHCWRDGDAGKVITLCFHYNGVPAAIASIVVSFALVPLNIGERIPVVRNWSGCGFLPCSFVAGLVCFTIALFTWHRMPSALCGRRGDSFFFDKLCVHQADTVLQAGAVASLPAFVGKSRALAILWSPAYFSRLWCTIEVAALVRLSTLNRTSGQLDAQSCQSQSCPDKLPLIWLPIELGKTVAKLLAVVCCTVVLTIVAQMIPWSQDYAPDMPVVVAWLLPFHIHSMRSYMRNRLALSAQLRDFSFEDAECKSDDDKRLLKATLLQWFGTLDEANSFVRSAVSTSVHMTMGSEVRFPLRLLLITCLPVVWNGADYTICYLNRPLELRVSSFLYTMVLTLTVVFVGQLSILIGRISARRWENPMCNIAATLAGTAVFCVIFALVTFPIDIWGFRGDAPSAVIATSTMFCVVGILQVLPSKIFGRIAASARKASRSSA